MMRRSLLGRRPQTTESRQSCKQRGRRGADHGGGDDHDDDDDQDEDDDQDLYDYGLVDISDTGCNEMQ